MSTELTPQRFERLLKEFGMHTTMKILMVMHDVPLSCLKAESEAATMRVKPPTPPDDAPVTPADMLKLDMRLWLGSTPATRKDVTFAELSDTAYQSPHDTDGKHFKIRFFENLTAVADGLESGGAE